MDFQVAAVTTSVSVVVLLAATIIARSIRWTGKQRAGHPLHAEKTAAYQLFMDLWGDFLRYGHTTEDRSPDTLPKELLALDCRLMLYGSASVVKAHAVLRALERDSGADTSQVRLQVATVLLEIRQDLGVGTERLTAEELLALLPAAADNETAPANASAYHTHSYQAPTPRVSLASHS